MDISTLTASEPVERGGGKFFRPYTVRCAIYIAVKDVGVGDKVEINSVTDSRGGNVSFAHVRASLNKIEELCGIKFTTRIINGSLHVWRMK